MTIPSLRYITLALGSLVATGVQASPANSAHVKSTTDLLGKIVAMETVKGRGQVPVMAEFLAKKLIDGGFSP
ncbi:MAG: hypothetical protein ACK46K_02945, partial [Gammaproteobacteria bacterium]